MCTSVHDSTLFRLYSFHVANKVRSSVDAGVMITPAQELRTPVAQELGLIPLIGDRRDTVYYLLCYKKTNKKTPILY